MDFFNAIVKFFQEGGPFMYPILLVFALGAAIAIERYLYLTIAKQTNRSMWDKLTPLMKANNYQQAMALSSRSKSEIGKIMAYGLSRLQISRNRDDIEIAMEEGLMEVIPRLEKRTHYLATYANIATLLGLLGTIIGLIQAFTAVANANPADKADLLSASISVAMNTTAFGLMAAIPLLLMFTVLQTKTTEIVDSMEMATVKFLNSITEQRKETARSAK
ncbi:MotA/TolQ/ExbB proton channel family protein [hydrothermal vent metagenome]|uniref:MotA/TolQ/ExbB proton channel family protein n=1 Tax=hydrothermal vent metagenome TaxID=652676 RepID=A0A3B1A7R6_9ZZZZ